jgi:hypothetical protein
MDVLPDALLQCIRKDKSVGEGSHLTKTGCRAPVTDTLAGGEGTLLPEKIHGKPSEISFNFGK